jgi:hypothetical protein
MKIAESMFKALMKRYEAEIAEAEATLLIYFNNPVGIGEHPQHLEEMDKMLDKYANAKDKLEIIQALIKIEPNGN